MLMGYDGHGARPEDNAEPNAVAFEQQEEQEEQKEQAPPRESRSGRAQFGS